jgi:hypothetical protein
MFFDHIINFGSIEHTIPRKSDLSKEHFSGGATLATQVN